MRLLTFLSLTVLVCGIAAAADDEADRAKLVGSWQMVPDNAQLWTFSTKGDSIKVVEVEQGNKVADFECNTDGKACEVKIGGKKASVSLWYNGAKLVELEQKGENVVERHFAAGHEPDAMEVEVAPISPAGSHETLKFKRAATVAKQ
jgi:hypothetical protein